jgi:hypothetical protein
MSDWRNFCRGLADISLNGDVVEVVTSNTRGHRIEVRETPEVLELTGIVLRASAVAEITDVCLRIWRHNRTTELVGFRLDHKGRLVGEAWVPKAGLTRAEFLLYVKHVAAECDRFEFHLTGQDRE